jgi:hypothetical protein|tara:strand:+ start:1634 stop:2137 length:504 start_codon:yes stop_codon:yes gene_type:complete
MKLQNIILESDEQLMAAQIKAVLDKELKDGELNEVLDPVSILSYLLLSNTVIDILGKYSAKVLRKLNLDKAADKAEAIHNWAHNNEKAMVNVIATVIKPFVRDEDKRQQIAKGLFIAVLAALGVQAGVGALDAIRGADVGGAALGMTKSALKGRDIAVVGKEILKAI